jgi:hypothetical protein
MAYRIAMVWDSYSYGMELLGIVTELLWNGYRERFTLDDGNYVEMDRGEGLFV